MIAHGAHPVRRPGHGRAATRDSSGLTRCEAPTPDQHRQMPPDSRAGGWRGTARATRPAMASMRGRRPGTATATGAAAQQRPRLACRPRVRGGRRRREAGRRGREDGRGRERDREDLLRVSDGHGVDRRRAGEHEQRGEHQGHPVSSARRGDGDERQRRATPAGAGRRALRDDRRAARSRRRARRR